MQRSCAVVKLRLALGVGWVTRAFGAEFFTWVGVVPG